MGGYILQAKKLSVPSSLPNLATRHQPLAHKSFRIRSYKKHGGEGYLFQAKKLSALSSRRAGRSDGLSRHSPLSLSESTLAEEYQNKRLQLPHYHTLTKNMGEGGHVLKLMGHKAHPYE